MRHVYVVKDKVAGTALGGVATLVGDAAAHRMFGDAVNAGDESIVAKHPGDFELWRVASFDEVTLAVVPCVPEMVVAGSAILASLGPQLSSSLVQR